MHAQIVGRSHHLDPAIYCQRSVRSTDKDAAAQRLLQNQDDIGNAIKPFYGEEAGYKLSLLLRSHILIAAELLQAAKNGDTAGFESAKTRWYENADEIAAFLNAANPKSWPWMR